MKIKFKICETCLRDVQTGVVGGLPYHVYILNNNLKWEGVFYGTPTFKLLPSRVARWCVHNLSLER